ncbi:MAG: adenylate/guanylate cyclase domain-containing protein [Elainellaceae cyanobacterium]
MMPRLSTILRLTRSRLSRAIVFWVFLSIVLVEAVILVPSYYRRQQELLNQLQQVSQEVLSSALTDSVLMQNPEDMLPAVSEKLRDDSVILGAALYYTDGVWIDAFGDAPMLEPEDIVAAADVSTMVTDYGGDRYDVGWFFSTDSGDFLLVVRHDASAVQPELNAFLWRIAGLVAIIALVVTAATMVTLGKIVIVPILRLRDDLLTATDIVGTDCPDPEFRSLARSRQDELGEVIQAFVDLYDRVQQEISDRVQAEAALREEQTRSEKLLLNILPATIATQLKHDQRAIAQRSEQVTILFADLVGFTSLSAQMTPTELVDTLNTIFSAFDRLAEQHRVEKIKTIGDAYMVVGGIPEPQADHATAIAQMALDMQQFIQTFSTSQEHSFQLRIGIGTGVVVSGVIGLTKFSYDLWGNVVNLASRMESQGIPGKIQVTDATYHCLKEQFELEERGLLKVKGWGEVITYFLVGRKGA